MATRPPLQCPLCDRAVSSETALETHLTEDHEKGELVEFVLTSWRVRADEGDTHPE